MRRPEALELSSNRCRIVLEPSRKDPACVPHRLHHAQAARRTSVRPAALRPKTCDLWLAAPRAQRLHQFPARARRHRSILGSTPFGSSSEALGHLRTFLRPLNAAARLSLGEAGEALIGLPKLNVPATRPVSLWSTNAIENVVRNYRGQTARVSRWRLETNPFSRWTATARLHVERGFHRLKG